MSTEAQKRASTNYNRNHDNIMIRPDKDTGKAIRAAAAAAGQSVQAFVLQAIRERMERMGDSPGAEAVGVDPQQPDTETSAGGNYHSVSENDGSSAR